MFCHELTFGLSFVMWHFFFPYELSWNTHSHKRSRASPCINNMAYSSLPSRAGCHTIKSNTMHYFLISCAHRCALHVWSRCSKVVYICKPSLSSFTIVLNTCTPELAAVYKINMLVTIWVWKPSRTARSGPLPLPPPWRRVTVPSGAHFSEFVSFYTVFRVRICKVLERRHSYPTPMNSPGSPTNPTIHHTVS